MELFFFSITIECEENKELGFFKSYKVLAINEENAINIVLYQKELYGKNVKIEEVQEIKYPSLNSKNNYSEGIIEFTGKAFFKLNKS